MLTLPLTLFIALIEFHMGFLANFGFFWGLESRNRVQPSTAEDKSNSARSFTFRELAVATQNFKETNLLGEGGFGKVYKGRLHSNQANLIPIVNLLVVPVVKYSSCGSAGGSH